MRFAGSLILGLLAINGLAQTVDSGSQEEPSAVAPQPAEPSAPAAEPSNPSPAEPSNPSNDDDTKPTNAEEQPSATGGDLKPTDEASQVSEGNQPSATASNGDDENASTAAEPSATADASATDDEPTATETGTDASDTATATATSSSAPTSTGAVVTADLKNATIGENAQLVKVDGKPAVKLNAPANGQATFSVEVDADDDFKTDELIYIIASIRVGESSGSAKLRRRDNKKTDCRLQIQADGQNVYDEPLYTNNGEFTDVTSTNGIQSSDQPKVQVTQKCGDTPSPLTVNDVRIGNENAAKSITSGGSGGSGSGGSGSGSGGKGGSGSGSGSGSGTSTGTSASASATGDHGNLGAKAKASVGALAAAIMAAAALV